MFKRHFHLMLACFALLGAVSEPTSAQRLVEIATERLSQAAPICRQTLESTNFSIAGTHGFMADPTQDPVALAAAAFEKGNHLSNEKQYREAIVAFNRAVQLDPKSAYYLNRAIAYSMLGDHQSAIQDTTSSLELEKAGDIFYFRGINYLFSGAHQNAMQDCSTAITMLPGYADAYYCRGKAKAALHDPIGAKEDFDNEARIKALNGNQSAKELFEEGVKLADSGKNMEAIDFFDRSLGLLIDVNTYARRGISNERLGREAEAIADFSNAITRQLRLGLKVQPELYTMRAYMYLDMKQYREAISDCTKIIVLDPNSQDAFETRARAEELLGDIAGAKRDESKARELHSHKQ